MTQVATVSTSAPNIRDEIEGWTFEDAALFVKRSHHSRPDKIFIGYTPSPKHIPYYGTVMEMLADGWKLLAPPIEQKFDVDGRVELQYEWWLTRG